MNKEFVSKLKELLETIDVVFDSDDTIYLIKFLMNIDNKLNLLIDLLGDKK